MVADRLLVALARSGQALERNLGRASRFLAGFVWATAPTDAITDVSIAVNGRTTTSPIRYGLYGWERPWLARDLPPPPARVLISGAGRGREVVALQELGYEVDALEPSDAFDELTARCEGRVWRRSHQDLAAGAGPGAGVTYDAVLLGWGSLTFLFEATDRSAIVRRAHELAPRGPILASYAPVVTERPRHGAAMRWGARLGSLASRGEARALDPGVTFFSGAGFLKAFTESEIERLGGLVGRRSVIEVSSMAFVTWPAPP